MRPLILAVTTVVSVCNRYSRSLEYDGLSWKIGHELAAGFPEVPNVRGHLKISIASSKSKKKERQK